MRAVIDEGLEPQITSVYAKGMSVRDIAGHLQALYGIELSADSDAAWPSQSFSQHVIVTLFLSSACIFSFGKNRPLF